MRPSRVRLAVAAIVAGCATIAAGQPSAAAGHLPLPTKDPFYKYAGVRPLRQLPVGTIIRRRSVAVSLGTNLATPVHAEQLLYRTRNQLGRPAVGVTTVLAPLGTLLGTRLVGYLSFYDGLGAECDPSYTVRGGYAGTAANEQQAEEEDLLVTHYLALGLTVTMPDFEGPHQHWGAGQESGYRTLDAIRATERYLGVPRSTKVALSGYSGGAIAADWASELAPRYASGINLVGVAEGGIPVNFAHNLRYVDGSRDWSGTIPAVLVGLSRAFHLDRTKYLSAYGRRITRQVSDECIGSFLGGYPGLTISRLMKPRYRDVLRVPAFARIIKRVTMGTAPGHPKAPLFMGVGDSDGRGDGVMLKSDVEALAREYCRQGTTVKLAVYYGSSHEIAGLNFEPVATTFLLQRFLGLPFTGDCSKLHAMATSPG
ncbi:MAG TPA: lipase family protein [Mycobacteriales bacterium]|nr:lipase family protein [Mycobacteriales bacterium]